MHGLRCRGRAMRREATGYEIHEWWIAYGVVLEGFVSGGGPDGMDHWMAETLGPAALIRMCDEVIDAAWEIRPAEPVSCMACIALDDAKGFL